MARCCLYGTMAQWPVQAWLAGQQANCRFVLKMLIAINDEVRQKQRQ